MGNMGNTGEMGSTEEMGFSALEAKVDELIALCDTLVQENKKLRAEQQAWHANRARVAERNDLAKTKIDAMIERMKHAGEADAAL